MREFFILIMICQNCGKEILRAGNFCEFCGAPLEKHQKMLELICKNCGNADLDFFHKEYLRLNDPNGFSFNFNVYICKKCKFAEFYADFPLNRDFKGEKIKK